MAVPLANMRPKLSHQLLNLLGIAAKAYLDSSKFLSSRGENMNDRFVDGRSLDTCKMFVIPYESCKLLQAHYMTALH